MGYQRRVHGDPHPSSAQQSTTSAPTAPAHQTTSKTTINNNTINMTDDSRKGLGDKVQEKVTTQESKSTTDKVKEGVTNTADKAQRAADSHKDDKSMMDKAKETLGMGGNK